MIKEKNKWLNEEKEEEKLFYLNPDIKPSGFYSYDVQWESINKGCYYRHLLFDLVNNAPIAELLAPDESTEITYKFINKSIKPHEKKSHRNRLKTRTRHYNEKPRFKTPTLHIPPRAIH